MTKKIIAITLSCLMIMTLITGCGNKKTTNNGVANNTDLEQTKEQVETKEQTNEDNETVYVDITCLKGVKFQIPEQFTATGYTDIRERTLYIEAIDAVTEENYELVNYYANIINYNQYGFQANDGYGLYSDGTDRKYAMTVELLADSGLDLKGVTEAEIIREFLTGGDYSIDLTGTIEGYKNIEIVEQSDKLAIIKFTNDTAVEVYDANNREFTTEPVTYYGYIGVLRQDGIEVAASFEDTEDEAYMLNCIQSIKVDDTVVGAEESIEDVFTIDDEYIEELNKQYEEEAKAAESDDGELTDEEYNEMLKELGIGTEGLDLTEAEREALEQERYDQLMKEAEEEDKANGAVPGGKVNQ